MSFNSMCLSQDRSSASQLARLSAIEKDYRQVGRGRLRRGGKPVIGTTMGVKAVSA